MKLKIKPTFSLLLLLFLLFYSLIFPAFAAAPSAPTSLYTGSTSAQSGSSNPSNITNIDPKFSSLFQDSTGGDTASKYELDVKTDYLDNVAGLWHFNEASGSAAADVSGNSNTGTIYARHENLVTYSQDFSNSAWGGYCGTKSNITQNTTDVLAPDGTQTAAKFVVPSVISCGSSTAWGVLQTVSPPITNNTYTVSVWLKGASGGEVVIIGLNDTHGASKTLTTSWARYTYTVTNTQAGVRGLQFSSSTANTTYYAWGAQLEKQSAASLYTATTATAANDGVIAYAGQYPSMQTAGKFGKGLTFNGVDNYVDAGNGASLNITSAITVSAWVKSAQSSAATIVTHDGGMPEYSFDMGVGTAGKLRFFGYSSGVAKGITVAGGTAVNNGLWHHIVGTFNGTDWFLYIDGVQDNTKTETAVLTLNAESVLIGRRQGASYFSGSIDEVRILNRALSADEILQSYRANKEHYSSLYDSGSSGTSIASCAVGARCADVSFAGTDSSLVGYWRMNEGTDDTVDGTKDVTDLSGNANHGTAYGMVTGTATSGSGTTLTDSSKSWTTNQWQNQKVKITGGTGSGQEAFISSNTATVLTLSSTLSPPPDATSTYKIMLWSQDGKWGGSTKFDKGMGMKFDGVDDYVDILNSASLNFQNGTVSFWMKTNGVWGTDGGSSSDTAIILGRGDASGSVNGFSILQNPSTGYVSAQIKNSASTVSNVNAVISLKDNSWHFVAMTMTQTNSGTNHLYIDGIENALGTNSASWSFNNQNLKIASSLDTWWEQWTGSLDEVRIYNRALSSEEILQEYQRGQASMSPLYNLGGRYHWRMKYWDQTPTEGSWSPTDSTNGNYFVMSRNLNSPTWDSTAFTPTQITTDNSTAYTITAAATDADGVDTAGVGIDKIETVLSQDNSLGNFTNPRGHFDWDNDSYTYANDNIACTGGGYASKDTSYGGSYVTLTGCTTSTAGNQRTVNFTFRANNTWGDNQDYDIAGYVTDESGFPDLDGWTNTNSNFDALPQAPSSPSGTADSTTAITWGWTDNSGSTETGFKVEDSSHTSKSGNLAAATSSWQESSGLSPNTSYTRHVHAFNTAGDSSSSGNASATTLSTAPTSSNISANRSTSTWYNTPSFVFTNGITGGFGGEVQYFRYSWDTSSTHTWTGSETQWSSGILTTTATSDSNSWYLHLKGYNSADAENGTLDLGPFYYDASAPSAPGSPSTTSPTNSASQTWSWTAATDALSGIASYAWRVINNAGTAITNGTAATNSVVTSLTQGIYTFFVKANDNAGNSGSEVSGALTVNTNIPTGSISINSGDGYTNSTSVTLNLASSDDTDSSSSLQMQISNNSDFSGASYEGFMASKAWTLPTTDGTKTVYTRFRDTSGNVSSTYSDTIVFDATAPNSFDLDSPGGGSYTNSERPTFRWKAASIGDETSGLSKYKLEIDSPSITIDNIPVSRTSDYETSKYTIHYDGFSDTDSSNNYISVFTKHSSDWTSSENDGKLKAGKRTWKVTAVDRAGNTTDASRTLYADYTNPSLAGITLVGADTLGTKDGYIISSTLRPATKGEISDNYSPNKIEISFYKQNFFLGAETGRTLFLKETFDLKNTTDKTTLSFSLSPSQDTDYGKYRVDVTGIDKAGNKSSEISFGLWVLSDDKAKIVLTEGKSEKEKKKITEELREKSQISLPELEKKAILRREREASEFNQAVQQLGDSFAFINNNLRIQISNLKTTTQNVKLFVSNTITGAVSFIAGAGEAASESIGNSILATGKNIGKSYQDVSEKVPGIAGDAMTAIGNGVYNFAAFNYRLGSEFSNQQENLKKQIAQTQKETEENLTTGISVIGGAGKTISNGISGINKELERSREQARKQIAKTHKSTSDGLSRIGAKAREGGNAALRSISRPAEESKNFADRLIKSVTIAVVTFESYMFDDKPTRIENVELAEIGKDYAIVTWKTNHYTRNNKVNYGESLTYDKNAWGKDGEKNHRVKITGLKQGKRYFFEVMSQNKNYAYDAYYSFETKK